MPNWCYNTLEITGSKKDLDKFKEILFKPKDIEIICKSDEKENLRTEFLEKLKQKPDFLENISEFARIKTQPIDDFINKDFKKDKIYTYHNLSLNESGDVTYEIKSGLLNNFYPLPKEEEENWYDWRVNYWGTKWDVKIDIQIYEDDCIFLSFDSAWASPTAWLDKISSDFPDLHFILNYEESGMGFKGIYEICRADDFFFEECVDWYGDCGECESEYDSDGTCECTDENGNKLKWGEEQ